MSISLFYTSLFLLQLKPGCYLKLQLQYLSFSLLIGKFAKNVSHGQPRSSIQKSEQKGLSFCGRVLSITTSGDKMASVTVPQFRAYIVSRAVSATQEPESEAVNMLTESRNLYFETKISSYLERGWCR